MTANANVTDVLRQLVNTNPDDEKGCKDATEQPKVAELGNGQVTVPRFADQLEARNGDG
jgi:hypothetical protein